MIVREYQHSDSLRTASNGQCEHLIQHTTNTQNSSFVNQIDTAVKVHEVSDMDTTGSSGYHPAAGVLSDDNDQSDSRSVVSSTSSGNRRSLCESDSGLEEDELIDVESD